MLQHGKTNFMARGIYSYGRVTRPPILGGGKFNDKSVFDLYFLFKLMCLTLLQSLDFVLFLDECKNIHSNPYQSQKKLNIRVFKYPTERSGGVIFHFRSDSRRIRTEQQTTVPYLFVCRAGVEEANVT